ncbi:MAG TPA: hypothetical protein VGM05_19875 [Planctomycetaceae bacterium]|jgi:hypothetical protein
MRTSVTITSGVALLMFGYCLGASQLLSPAALFAQGGAKAKPKSGADAQDLGLTDETKAKIKAAADALKAAMEALEGESKIKESATKGLNTFTVLTGGGSTLDDLKSAGGVDPETFAALYAGLASDKVVVDLGRDPDGKLTYKNRVVRMYPISAIRAAYARRADITGEELLPASFDDSAKKPAKKPADTEEKTEEEQ